MFASTPPSMFASMPHLTLVMLHTGNSRYLLAFQSVHYYCYEPDLSYDNSRNVARDSILNTVDGRAIAHALGVCGYGKKDFG
jgi:hypothetical protein